MKKLISLILMCTICVSAHAQTPMFTYDNEKRIVCKPSFIQDIEVIEIENVTPYRNIFNMPVLWDGETYSLQLLKYKDWDDLGDFQIIQILQNDQTLLKVEDCDGWVPFPQDYTSIIETHPYHADIDLDNQTKIFVFTGLTIMSQIPFFTVVALKDGKATLVCNIRGEIKSVQKNDAEIRFILQTRYAQYTSDEKKVYDAGYNTVIIKGGMMFWQ